MKKLKTILCVLLSGMFLLFVGACMPKIYTDTTSNEFVNITLYVNKTTCKGPDDSVKIRCNVTVKKEFWIWTENDRPEDYIRIIAFNDKNDQEYYMSQFKIWNPEDFLFNPNSFIQANEGFLPYIVHCKKGRRMKDTASSFMRRRDNGDRVVSTGKYRLYLKLPAIYLENPLDENGNFKKGVTKQNFLIPTDIVLDMQ